MKYHDLVIEASDAKVERDPDKRRWRRFKVRVLSSRVGDMTPEQAVPVQCNENDLQDRLRGLDRRELDRDGLLVLGRLLGLLLLPPGQDDAGIGVRELFSRSLDRAEQENAGLRMRLRLPPELAAIPWEYLYLDRVGATDGMAGFLALDPRIAIVRHEALPISAPSPRVTGDIAVLAALASPLNLDLLDLDREEHDLRQALSQQGGVQLTVLKDATLDEVQKALPNTRVFHFAGHGIFQQQSGDLPGTVTGAGSLALDDGMVDAEKLGVHLRGNQVQLVVLGGCETGRRAGAYVWGGIAPALVRFEVPAVVANQYSILDKCAIAFSRQFYCALAGGLPIERAVSAGRIAAYSVDQNGRDWGVPVLYLRAADGELFEGAADAKVREAARQSAEADVHVRVREVAAGGFALGAKVREMLSGKLRVEVNVAGTVYGTVVGVELETLRGGSANVNVQADTVGPGGRFTGATIDSLGGDNSRKVSVDVGSVIDGQAIGTQVNQREGDTVPSWPSKAKPSVPKQAAARTRSGEPKQARGEIPTVDSKMNVGKVTGGEVIGTQVNQVIRGEFVDARTIVEIGPEGVREIVRLLMQSQGDPSSVQAVMARTAPEDVGRQISAVVSAQRQLAASGVTPDPETAYRLGMLAAYRRDYDTALSYFRQATQADPEYRDAFAALSWLQQYLAMSDLGAGNFDAVLDRLAEAREAAMHTDPLRASDIAQRGYIYKTLAQVAESRHQEAEREKYYSEAGRFFEQATKLDPHDASAQNGLGNVLCARRDLDGAIAAYRRAINLAPGYTAAHHDLALAFEQKITAEPPAAKQWRERALEAWQEAYRLAPSDPGFSADDVLAIGQRIDWLKRQQDG